MVLLDTNAVSELMRDEPNSQVRPWMDGLATREMFVTAVTEAEILPVAQSDGQIAAIARSRGMTAAARNVRDFSETGVDVPNPWTGV